MSVETLEQAKKVAISYAHAVWDDQDITAIDRFFHPEAIIHSVLGDYKGSTAIKEVIQTWLHAFPDLKVTNTAVFGEEDRVAIQWKAQGTHKGMFKNIGPTDKQIHYQGVTIYQVQDERIIAYWVYIDMNDLLRQIKPL